MSEGAERGRRELLGAAAVGVAASLAGCGRGLRGNRVPGGVRFVNERPGPVRIRVRALLEGQTPGQGTATPLGDTATVEAVFPVPGETTRVSQSFFPQPGSYVIEARAGDRVGTGRIKLYRTVGGGVGADTLTVRVTLDGEVVVSVSDVD